ncbi:MAG: YdbL family protein [Sphingopyxis sp.]|jgi:uncharacterized protein|nr:YdbL family protein [Sphingopyxis sp.]
MRAPVALVAAALGLMLVAAPASAQRDPAYAAARAAGQVGEMPDGYLGFPSAPSAEVRRIVDDINIRRRAEYTRLAQTSPGGATVEQVAFVTGCNLIARTVPGERYMSPDGSWRTRTAEPPMRDARCI